MNFWRCAWAFFVRDAAMAVSYPVAFSMGLLSTAARVVMLWLPAQLLLDNPLFASKGGFLPYSIIGTSVMSIFLASYGGFASAVRSEQMMGTLESVMMTPVRLPAIVVGSNLWTLCNALVDALVTLTTGVLVFGIALKGNPLAALCIVLLTNLSFVAVGILSASFAVLFKKGDPFRVVVASASFLMGGVIYPPEILPHWLQLCAQLLPVTHGALALRGVLLEGHALSLYAREMWLLAGFALVGIPLSVACFAWCVRRAKHDGTLLQF